MKKILKIAIPTLLLALIVSAIFITPSSAASVDKDVYYATWSSEEAYLQNPEAPDAVYKTPTLTTGTIANVGYVKCYKDVSVTENVQFPVKCNTTLDLGGNTLSTKAKFIVNGSDTSRLQAPGSVTIKNGNVVHLSGQFIQGRSNAEVYLKNVDIFIRGGNTFVTSYSMRLMHFDGCNINIESSGNANVGIFEFGQGYDPTGKDTYHDNADFVVNVLFENSAFIDNTEYKSAENYKSKLFLIPNSSGNKCLVNITFGYGAGFNRMLANFLINQSTNPASKITVNVAKGARFADAFVPNESEIVLNYYNYAKLNGNTVSFGDRTELLPAGEEQSQQEPKLIFGKSGNDVFPYQLCHYLCDVTWVSKGQSVTVTGYADNLYAAYTPETRGDFFNPDDNNLVYRELHKGWSLTEDGSEFFKEVLVTENSTFYAGFESYGPAVMVEYASSSQGENEIINAFFDNQITDKTEPFGEGSYVKLYGDVELTLGTTLNLPANVTVDLGGKTIYRTLSINDASLAVINVSDTAKIENGTVRATLLPLFNVSSSGTLILDNVDVSYSGAPIAYLAGRFSTNDSKLKERGNSPEIPAFILKSSEASLSLNTTEIYVSGVLATTSEKDGFNYSVEVNDCMALTAGALFVMEKSAVDAAVPSDISFNVTGSSVITQRVFDIPLSSLGEMTVKGEFNLSNSSFTQDPTACDAGRVVLGEGQSLIYSEGVKFPYRVISGELTMKFGMSLLNNFIATFYIPTSVNIKSVTTYYATIEKGDLTVEELTDGEYYAIRIPGISALDSMQELSVTVSYVGSDEKDYNTSLTYSPIDYFSSLLQSADVLERKLCASALRYVYAAYIYGEKSAPEALTELMETEAYRAALRDFSDVPVTLNKLDMGNINNAFTGAQLYLSGSISLRLNLKSSFNGTLTIQDKTYTVVNGLCNGVAFIEIEISAYDLYSKQIKIMGADSENNEISGSYSLATYAQRVLDECENDALTDMLSALYVLTYEAFVYGNGGILPPEFVDTLPPFDVEWH